MRDNVKDFVRLVVSTMDLKEPIFEFGSYQVPEQAAYADLRPLFPGKAYVGCDMREGPGVDRVLDLHSIAEPTASVGTVLCLDTLEHVEDPRKAVIEMWRILKPGGTLIMSSVMNFPIHNYPFDYWRFTPEAFRSLLKPFSSSFVGYQGSGEFPHTIVGAGWKELEPRLDKLEPAYLSWQTAEPRPSPVVRTIKSLLPPILLPIASRLYGTILPRRNR
jgi:SAM-dependent methyltransferase